MKNTFTNTFEIGRLRRIALLSVSAALLSACATTATRHTPARIDVQQDVGFTITEEGRVSNDARSDFDVALALLAQGNHDRGVEMLESVADMAPYLSAPRIDLGIAYHRAGDLEAAEHNLLLALEAHPEHPIAHNEIGIVYRKTGRFADARRSYEAALMTYPGYHYARRNLAVLCDLYLADLSCALENYQAYMATVPDDEQASMWIADIRQRMGPTEE